MVQFYESILTYRQQTLHLRGLGKNSQAQPGGVPPRPRQAGDEPLAHRGSVHMTQDTCGKQFLPTSPSACT